MGSEIFKGCEGVCRILILVFLFVAFGLFVGVCVVTGGIGVIVVIVICLIILIIVVVWYSLLFMNKVTYSPAAQKNDGLTQVICGSIFVFLATGALLWGIFGVIAAGGSLTGDGAVLIWIFIFALGQQMQGQGMQGQQGQGQPMQSQSVQGRPSQYNY